MRMRRVYEIRERPSRMCVLRHLMKIEYALISLPGIHGQPWSPL